MNDGKIIIDKIIADADETVKKITADAKEAAEATINSYEDKAAKEKARNNKAVADEKAKVISKQISSAKMDAKKAVLAQKQIILEDVINEAEKRLLNLSDPEYANVIGTMLDSINKNLGTEVIVSSKDRVRIADVIEKKGFVLSDKTADIDGGFIIKNGDIEYNYSFNSIITIEKDDIQQIAAKILFE
ncbi:V-type proton ATPase subunit E [bioreactor metagenome]|uniref:V-type proton ATPase subunit E n=1 Tax=bioreactor metagenome TaxID=1076179 RepID=A0A645CMF0_9ZZZZ|nr:V-type ATP synthase subunit E [Candidatus Metalachnospira sp.]